MYYLEFAPGFEWNLPTPAGARMLSALDRATGVLRTNLTLTAGTNGKHSGPADPHYRGCAFDVGVANLQAFQVKQLKIFLESVLGNLFTVLYETPSEPKDPTLAPIAYVNPGASGPHLHLQPAKGSTWPPAPAAAPTTAA